ncbi:Starch-binding associating with outer membrane [Pedobacter westerhofensis]|uniref:Starch-binding associating with outer membrane n=1 Tax=Pedobacter westerhofensis TaxID=425512 RepID=A0A521DE60_9SPHI|nr:RagB/SusD family nutrient uptake outer membrane protein [Pedobacter westerhofensis]SMO70094.1 Starch-binding associating with outer membrane [Pedobacter westerhofensis]
MKLYKIFTAAAILMATLSSCKKDLNLTPTNDLTSDVVYATPAGYKQVLAKVYASFATTSGSGSGNSDLGGIDAGTSDFIRLYWNAQELTSDEGLCVWNDAGVYDLNYMTFSADNIILRGLYTRSLYQITVANEFLRESTDEKLASRNITGADATNIAGYRAEARFLRAYQYWVLMDLFGNPPILTEENTIGIVSPKQIKRADLFKYVESELLAVEPLLMTTPEYGRASKGAADMLLSRLYLNAAVYTGTAKYTEAITYASKVIAGNYRLQPAYKNLFLSDNDQNNLETILAINYDGNFTQNYGGTTFIINASINGDMNPASFGVPNGGWGGIHASSTLPALFGNASATDQRYLFFGTKAANDDIGVFTDGLRVTKFKNINQAGVPATSNNGTFSSVDFPLFRLPEAYLNYAEAVLRGGTGGTTATALTYVNLLRSRAYGNDSGNVSSLTLDNILTERAKEFYWEGYRRTDLVRYGRFTDGSYVWPWKGGVRAGRAVDATRNIFPLPTADVIANTNLTQNPGY